MSRPINLSISGSAFISMSIWFFAVSGLAYAAVPVTSCGQVLSSGGYLTGDLNCTGVIGPPAITLEGGTLNLQGYAISADLRGATVRCTKSCRVRSTEAGGMLVGKGVDGVPTGDNKVTLRINNVTIDSVSGWGVYVAEGKVFVKDSMITNVIATAISKLASFLTASTATRDSPGIVVFRKGGRNDAPDTKLRIRQPQPHAC